VEQPVLTELDGRVERPTKELAVIALGALHVARTQEVPNDFRVANVGAASGARARRLRERDDGAARIAHHLRFDARRIHPFWPEGNGTTRRKGR
jgi:hypothetical protein